MRIILKYILRYLSKLILAKYKPFIIALTGSVGKTSTKEAIFIVINHRFSGRVRKSEKNLNTEIGLPLAIIGGEDAGRNIFLWAANLLKALGLIFLPGKYPSFLILEMAADRPGDIDWLTSFIKPDIGIITAIGRMPPHLEFFSNRGDYINEKMQVITSLKEGGLAILNFDDPLIKGLAERLNKEITVLSYGFGNGVDIQAKSFNYHLPSSSEDIKNAHMEIKVTYNKKDTNIDINNTLGGGAVYFLLAAFAVGIKMNLNPKEITEAFFSFKPEKGRMTLTKGIKQTIILDDTYNASPLSFEVALATLGKFTDKRKIAIMGDMRELGPGSEEAHRQLGSRAAGIADIIFLVGDNMRVAREEMIKNGFLENKNLYWFETSEQAKKVVQDIIRQNDVILIKGSRALKMDLILEEIEEQTTAAIV